MPKTGRPKKVIDKKSFEGLCSLQCSKVEMQQFLGVSDKLLDNFCKANYSKSFSEVFREKRVGGLISLRRSGFKLAQTNAAVWIFLSKNFLGMNDNPNLDSDQSAKPISVTIMVENASIPKNHNDSDPATGPILPVAA